MIEIAECVLFSFFEHVYSIECSGVIAILSWGIQEFDKLFYYLLFYADMEERLDFAIAHQDWTLEDWKKVAWSDEHMFLITYAIFLDKRNVYICSLNSNFSMCIS
jgi:hypothetical protein